MNKQRQKCYPAGFVVQGGGMGGGALEGPAELIFAGLIGSLLGFICGMFFGSIVRVITLNARNGVRGGLHWAAWGAGAGALGLAMVEFFD